MRIPSNLISQYQRKFFKEGKINFGSHKMKIPIYTRYRILKIDRTETIHCLIPPVCWKIKKLKQHVKVSRMKNKRMDAKERSIGHEKKERKKWSNLPWWRWGWLWAGGEVDSDNKSFPRDAPDTVTWSCRRFLGVGSASWQRWMWTRYRFHRPADPAEKRDEPWIPPPRLFQ